MKFIDFILGRTSNSTPDYLAGVKGTKTVKVPLSGIMAIWGNITGTLSDQTDLKSALDSKQPIDTVETNLVPFNGGGQANATQITANYNDIPVVLVAGDSVKLPLAIPGLTIRVRNSDMFSPVACYPYPGDEIGGTGAPDVNTNITTNMCGFFFCCKAGFWDNALYN